MMPQWRGEVFDIAATYGWLRKQPGGWYTYTLKKVIE